LDAAFEHLCLDVFPDGRRGTQLLIYLTARFDESVNDQPGWPRIYTVAGWLCETKPWKQFRGRWDSLNAKYGIDWFHTTDFIGGYKQFRDWTDAQEKDQRYREYCKLIRKFHLQGFGSAINTSAYDAVITPELAKRGLGNRYYGFNIVRVLEDIEDWIDSRNFTEPASVHYVFAQNKDPQVIRDIGWLFNLLCEDDELRQRFRIGSEPWSLGDMRRDARLQPADILACLANRYAARFAKTPEWRTEHWWEVMIETLKVGADRPRLREVLYNDEETLRLWVNRVAQIEDLVSPVTKGFAIL
jgi:hypothetical protein